MIHTQVASTGSYAMDISEFTKIVFDRIQKIEPELVSKIIGYLLLKEYGDREMIRLAFGPDNAIHSLINEAKSNLSALSSSPKPVVSAPVQHIPDFPMKLTSYPPDISRRVSSPSALHIPPPYWNPQLAYRKQSEIHNIEYVSPSYTDSIIGNYQLHNHESVVNPEEHLYPGNPVAFNFPRNYYQESSLGGDLSSRTWRTSTLQEFPVKACHYFYKGYCKHGTNCRYHHGQSVLDGFPQLFSPNSSELANEDHMFSPGSLEKLEAELKELLKSRGGQPISIAMLPNVYYEKYGKVLQGDGYLTESQRHGKAGCSLTKLLARLSSSIRLIDRPHGQHSVILAEDAPAHLEYKNERSDPGNIVFGSHQIYLTFPADSTFTEDDVSNYFKHYGPVRAVRIPAQLKRMFGFVTFVYPETVKLILMKGNPHYVCGARVLVKPYREKLRGSERKYSEMLESQLIHPSQHLETDPGLHLESLRTQQLEEHQQILEIQRQRLSALPITPSGPSQKSFFGFSVGKMRCPDADHSRCQFDDLNNGSTGEEKVGHARKICGGQESNSIDLPDSPFASPPVGTDIVTRI